MARRAGGSTMPWGRLSDRHGEVRGVPGDGPPAAHDDPEHLPFHLPNTLSRHILSRYHEHAQMVSTDALGQRVLRLTRLSAGVGKRTGESAGGDLLSKRFQMSEDLEKDGPMGTATKSLRVRDQVALALSRADLRWELAVMLERFGHSATPSVRSFSYTLRPSTAAVSAAFGVDALKQLAA